MVALDSATTSISKTLSITDGSVAYDRLFVQYLERPRHPRNCT